MNADIAIKVESLSKVFQLRQPRIDEEGNATHEHWALKDVSFEIKKGESVGIIGPNGSGKSTLLQILAGVTKPTSGSVSIRGKVASILDIGAGFHPELSGRENVFLNGQIHGFSKKDIEEKFEEIVAFSGIEEFIEEPVKNYSQGMYLRLAFSIMIHLDFDVYLLDEVLSVGDEEFQNKCIDKIGQLVTSNKTVLIVHHNMYYSDKIITREISLKKENDFISNQSTDSIFDEKIVLEQGVFENFSFPIRLFKKDRETALILVLKSAMNVNLASSEIYFIDKKQLSESLKLNFEFKLNLAFGTYFLYLYDVTDDKLDLLYSTLIRVLKNKNSFEKYGNQANSVLFFNSKINLI